MEGLQKQKAKIPPFGAKDKIGYALGDFGCGLSFSLIQTYMYIFYTQYIGLSTAIWSAIIIFTKVWDAVNDPLMGGIMDKVRFKKGGKFKPWIKIGSYGLIISAALVFLPIPDASTAVKVVVCVSTYLIWDICYTLVNVPYGAFNAAITSDTAGRSALSSFRSIGAGIAGLLIMLIPLFVYDENKNLIGGRMIYFAAIFGVVAFISFRLFLKMTHERVEVVERVEKFNYFKTIKAFFSNRSILALSLASFALIVFFTSTTTTNSLIFQIYFKNPKLATPAMILSYVPLVGFIPFTGKFVRKFGKKLTAGVPLIISVIASAVMLVIPFNPLQGWSPWVYIVGLVFIQTGGGMFQLICWAMVADCIDYQYLKTGKREEGSIYAIYSLFRKLAQGVALSFVPLTMVWVGYKEGLQSNQPMEVAERMKDVSILLVLAGSIIMLVAVLWLYSLGKKDVEEMNKKLRKNTDEIDINEALGGMRD